MKSFQGKFFNLLVSLWVASLVLAYSPIQIAYYTDMIDQQRVVLYGNPIVHTKFSYVSSLEWDYDLLGVALNLILWGVLLYFPVAKLLLIIHRFKMMRVAILTLMSTASIVAALALAPLVSSISFGALIYRGFFDKSDMQREFQIIGACIAINQPYYLYYQPSGLICDF